MGRIQLPDQLRICMIAQKFPILGRASDQGFLWPVAKGLALQGHHVTVIAAKSPLGKQEVHRDGVRVFYLHEGYPNYSHMKFDQAAYLKLAELNKLEPFHLAHCIDKFGLEIGRHKKELGVAVAYDVNATEMSQIFSIMGMVQESVGSILATTFAMAYKFLTTYFSGDRELLATANGVFVTSPQQRIFLERFYLYPDYHTYSVPYGIELGDLSPRPEASELKKTLKLPENAKVVVTITDMMEPKEVINILTAFERVVVKKPSSHMVIIGHGPGWKEIEYNMLNLALGGHVIMTGALKAEEMSDYISIADVFVNMSSRSTGLEPSMIEAMSQKKVIVGSEVSPVANIVEDGVDGFLLRPADTDSLAVLLIEIFAGTLPVIEIRERAREKVVNLFDTRKMIHTVEDAYRTILLNTKLYK